MKRRSSARKVLVLVLSVAAIFGLGVATAQKPPFVGARPKEGFVPDAATAEVVAEAVLKPVFGAKLVQSELPLFAHLDQDVWRVQGTPPGAKTGGEGRQGGAVIVWLSKKDGRILYMSHTK